MTKPKAPKKPEAPKPPATPLTGTASVDVVDVDHTIVRPFAMGTQTFAPGDEGQLGVLSPRELSIARGLGHITRNPAPAE